MSRWLIEGFKYLHGDAIAGDWVRDLGQGGASVAFGMGFSKFRKNPESAPAGTLREFQIETLLLIKTDPKFALFQRDDARRLSGKMFRFVCQAGLLKGAERALRYPRSADGCPEIHEGGGSGTASRPWVEGRCDFQQQFLSLSAVNGGVKIRPAGENADNIGIEDKGMEIVSKSQDGCRRVISYSGQGQQGLAL